jgi:hypothetical protein
LDSRLAARVANSHRVCHILIGQHAGGHKRKGRKMLKSQGIEAIPDSAPPFQVFIFARRRPQLNTLRLNT